MATRRIASETDAAPEHAPQPPAAEDAVSKIQFHDDDAPKNVHQLRTRESDAANQKAAKKFLEEQKSAPVKPPVVKPQSVPLSRDDAARIRPKLYRVRQTITLPKGAGAMTLRAGKILDNRNYDIDGLVRAGVDLIPFEDR